ncbi:hypothetical protein ACVWY3_000327 [Bradyrhizobium sp. USDA 4486]
MAIGGFASTEPNEWHPRRTHHPAILRLARHANTGPQQIEDHGRFSQDIGGPARIIATPRKAICGNRRLTLATCRAQQGQQQKAGGRRRQEFAVRCYQDDIHCDQDGNPVQRLVPEQPPAGLLVVDCQPLVDDAGRRQWQALESRNSRREAAATRWYRRFRQLRAPAQRYREVLPEKLGHPRTCRDRPPHRCFARIQSRP